VFKSYHTIPWDNPELLTYSIYNWADIYSQQLKCGQEYLQLRPIYAIWLVAENLLVDDDAYEHHYKMRDEQGQSLTPHVRLVVHIFVSYQQEQINIPIISARPATRHEQKNYEG